MRIAVDIGGTFTDLVAVDDQGKVSRSKALTTPDDLARGIEDCLRGASIDVAGASFFVHGSTVTINAVLERKGARTGLITTKGFRDVYEIGRINRPESFNLFFRKHQPLVPRNLRCEVEERLDATGTVVVPLDEVGTTAVAQRLDEIQAVAARQHDVHDGDVWPGLEREREPALAVVGDIDRKARLTQASSDEVGDGRVVFDDEGLHGNCRLLIADC